MGKIHGPRNLQISDAVISTTHRDNRTGYSCRIILRSFNELRNRRLTE